MNDRAGAVRKAELVGRQKAELDRRRATALPIDVQQMLSDAADPGPIRHNEPAEWSFGFIDKGGFLRPPISEAEARARQDEEARADIAEYLAITRAPERAKREADGGNRQTSLDAT